MTMICDETIIKLMRTHHKHAKLHSCLNKLNVTLNNVFSCSWKCRHRYSRSPATEYSFFGGILSAIFYLRVNVVPPLHQ